MEVKSTTHVLLRIVMLAAVIALSVGTGLASGQALPAGEPATPAVHEGDADRITIGMSPCEAVREGRLTGMGSLLGALLAGPPRDQLVRKGTLVLEGRTHTFYLPKAESYSVQNTGDSNDQDDNTSTLISIDMNGDGKLVNLEGWYANLPIRLDDAMFEITSIAEDGGRIELRRSAAPLSGLVVGRKCPPFSFETTDGRKMRLDDYRGKALLLDVWSVT